VEQKFEEMSFVDNSPNPLNVGDLKRFLKMMEEEGNITDSTPVLIPGYEDRGYDHIVAVSTKVVREYLDHEEDIYDPRYTGNSIPKLKPIEAIVLKSDKYLMRKSDAPE